MPLSDHPDPRRLQAPLPALLEAAAAVAGERGERLHLVGGAVRDLLLGRQTADLDLTIEGDGPAFARDLARRVGAAARPHEEFGTAEISGPGWRLDVATARRERYRDAAVLPEVEPAGIDEDLGRRDFSVNAMALELAGPEPGRLRDPHGGRDDLRSGTLRLLHPASLRDDPTRALRAVRYGARLGLRLHPEVSEQIDQALSAGSFARLSGARLLAELRHICEEDSAVRRECVRLLADTRVARALHPHLAPSPRSAEALERVCCLREELAESLGTPAAGWAQLLALTAELPEGAGPALGERLGLQGEPRRLVDRHPGEAAEAVRELALRVRDSGSRLDEACRRYPAAVLLLAAAVDRDAEAAVRRWNGELAHLRLAIGGAELIAAGVASGPALGEALEQTRAARLDGTIAAGEELGYALSVAGRVGAAGARQ